jgi:hypothetical protein
MADVPGVAIVIGIFFVAGLVVGGIVVIALAMLKDRRPTRTGPGDSTIQRDYERGRH